MRYKIITGQGSLTHLGHVMIPELAPFADEDREMW